MANRTTYIHEQINDYLVNTCIEEGMKGNCAPEILHYEYIVYAYDGRLILHPQKYYYAFMDAELGEGIVYKMTEVQVEQVSDFDDPTKITITLKRDN